MKLAVLTIAIAALIVAGWWFVFHRSHDAIALTPQEASALRAQMAALENALAKLDEASSRLPEYARVRDVQTQTTTEVGHLFTQHQVPASRYQLDLQRMALVPK